VTISKIKTYSGLELDVRDSNDDDEPLLVEFWKHVSKADLARRLDNEVNPDHLDAAAQPRAAQTETFLAFGGDRKLLAIAIMASALGTSKAKVTVFTDERATYHGVSWALLNYVLERARENGMKTVESIFSAKDIRASRVEQKMGFVEVAHPGEGDWKILQWTFAERSTLALRLQCGRIPLPAAAGAIMFVGVPVSAGRLRS
jgi:L-amino acid N-acyltransferase YncA